MTNIQAIDLLKGLEQSLDDYCELNDEGKTAFHMAITALELFGISEQLLSSQPEIIRCKDCKYYSVGGDGLMYCWKHNDDILWHDYDFCSKAERRTDG